jgi:NADH-quinone oxidoreductase subunit G
MIALGRAEASLNNEDAMINALCGRFPELEGMKTAAPSSEFRIGGQKVARKSFGYSGRTAIDAAKRVAEKSTTIDDDTALSYSMEGAQSQMPSSLIPRYWAPRWNSVQALNKYQTETGGALKGGECGVRLFSTPPDRDSGYVTHIPMSFTAHPEAFLVIPLYHIFGSEELSVAAPSIREVCTAPYVLLNTEDALAMEVGPGDVVEVSNEARAYLFNVNIAEWLTRGTAGLPAGFNATRSIDLPQLLWIRKDGHG